MLSPPHHPDWLTLHAVVVLLALATYVSAALALRQRRHPSAAIAWVVSLALLPYLALPLFLMFGLRKTVRAAPGPRPAASAAGDATPAARLQALAAGLGMPPASAYRDLEIHEEGAAALERLQLLLRQARRSIEVATFLLGNDPVGAQLCALLAQRAREGVQVRLMIDGVGRYLGGRPPLGALRAAGVQVRLFSSPWSSPLLGARANLRNHRKLVLADGEWLWTGGRNLAAEYFGPVASRHGRTAAAWTDLTFDLHGPLCSQVLRQFEADWRVAVHDPSLPPPPASAPAPDPGASDVAQFLPSGPDQSDDTVHALLVDACFTARRRILVLTPYFVPGEALQMVLGLAARRGIVVDLVVPRRSNHRLADAARPPSLRELMDAGGRVWLSRDMVHAKLVVVDEAVAFSGSLNLDERSLFLNYEMMIAFCAPPAVGAFARWGDAVRDAAQPMRRQRVGVLREFGEGLLRWLTFQL